MFWLAEIRFDWLELLFPANKFKTEMVPSFRKDAYVAPMSVPT
jgi:hypothetical protein